MKTVKYGKIISGESIPKVLPRLEYFKNSTSILDIKRFVAQKVKPIFKDFAGSFKTDGDINDHIMIQIYDNLPYERTSHYSSKKATCEFCQ